MSSPDLVDEVDAHIIEEVEPPVAAPQIIAVDEEKEDNEQSKGNKQTQGNEQQRIFRQPRGRPRLGCRWDSTFGKWVPDTRAAVQQNVQQQE